MTKTDLVTRQDDHMADPRAAPPRSDRGASNRNTLRTSFSPLTQGCEICVKVFRTFLVRKRSLSARMAVRAVPKRHASPPRRSLLKS